MLTTLISAVTQFSQEEPPHEFRVEYFWRPRGIVFNRLDFFKTVLFDMALLAAKDFQLPVFGLKCPTPFQIAFNFVSDRTANTKVKHVMWALDKIFEIFVSQQRYAPGNVIVEIPPTRLGVGNVQFDPLVHSSNASVESFVNVSPESLNSTFTLPVSDISVLADAVDMQGNGSNAQTMISNNSLRGSEKSDSEKGKNVHVDVSFYADAHTFPDAQIVNASLQLLIRAGQPANIHEAIGPLFSTYNEVADFTISLAPHSYAKTNELSWLDCINSITAIVTAMAREGPEGLWEELSGLIRDDQQVIGRFCIDKGDWTRVDPETVCVQEEQGSVNVQ